jgi:hypothetical protein
MHSFYKNKKPGKQRVFRKKKDAKKGEAAGSQPKSTIRVTVYTAYHTETFSFQSFISSSRAAAGLA